MSAKNPHDLSRRDFFKVVSTFVGSVIGLGVGVPLVGYFLSPALERTSTEAWIPVGPLEKFPLGQPVLFSFTRSKQYGWEKRSKSYGVYIIRKAEQEVEVLSNVCTHLGCRVKWHEDKNEYICPCHDAHFSKDGEVISGPAPAPLEEYEVKIEDGVVYIHLVEGKG